MAKDNEIEVRPLTDEEAKARGRRNVWLALALVAFVMLVLTITIVRLSQGIGAMADGGF
ncbi:MAG: hypothetical protein AAF829_00570 [Pseudomonadota bacterium]